MKHCRTVRLTETLIKKTQYKNAPIFIRDDKTTGLMVVVNKNSKSYKIQCDLWVGHRGRRQRVKTIRHTFNTTDNMTLEEARIRAAEDLSIIKRGIDPYAAPKDATECWTVERLFNEYYEDLRMRDKSERTILNMNRCLNLYLKKWKLKPIDTIERSFCRSEHIRITKNHGPVVANHALKAFRTCYNFALKIADNPDQLPSNPVIAVTFNRERSSNRVLTPDYLPEWYNKVQALGSPMRREMHLLGLLSALRPGTLVTIKRTWISLDQKTISIPYMKSGRSFDLPLSDYMLTLIERVLQMGDVLYPGNEWLFPSRSNKTKEVISTKVWKEKTLPSETGHILRHTYRTIAQRICINVNEARLLMDHKVQGIDGVYIHEKALFDKLLATQNIMTKAILELCGCKIDLHDNSACTMN